LGLPCPGLPGFPNPLASIRDLSGLASIPPFPKLSDISSTAQRQVDVIYSTPAKVTALSSALTEVLDGKTMDDALKKAGLGNEIEGGRLALERAKQLSGEIDTVVAEANTSNLSKENGVKVTCFVLKTYANRGRMPTSRDYERFGVDEKLNDVPVVGPQVEHAKIVGDLVARMNNNTPEKIALRAAVSLVCSGVRIID